MKLLGTVLILLFSNTAFSQSSCIMLEGLNLGCVSSIDHSCFMNKKTDSHTEPCRYVGSPNSMYRVEAPISFHCKSSTNTTVCPPPTCNPDGCIQPPCVTTSECVEYQPPSCDETCVTCFDEVVNVNVGISKGCIICTRPKCADEPLATVYCPSKYNNLINAASQKCSEGSRCPTTAVDPLGHSHEVVVRTGTCPPPEMPKEPTPTMPSDCPWKVDERSDNGCERIRCDNRNPAPEPGCTDP